VRTTIPEPSGQTVPDLLCRDFTAPAPNRRYVGDITYLPLADGQNLYLATVIDCHSRRVAGWAVADHMRVELIQDALTAADATRGSLAGAVFHSDHGSVGGFKWLSQHLDDGGVVRWRDADSSMLIERSGRHCGLRGGHRLGWRWNGSSGGASPRASRVRTPQPRWACRNRWERAGFATVAGCHQSVLPNLRAGTCRSPNARR
jgi:hypothetical protein